MSHTPGPWAAHEGWPSDVWHVDMPGRTYSIGVSRADSDEDMAVEEVQANARLIACAPEMLDALRLAADALDLAQAQVDSENDRYNLCKRLVAVKRVIAKAEGSE